MTMLINATMDAEYSGHYDFGEIQIYLKCDNILTLPIFLTSLFN